MSMTHDRGEETGAPYAGPRSPHWHSRRNEFLATNPDCFACDPDSPFEHVGIQAHHLYPYHYCVLAGRPDLELDFRNLVPAGETEEGKPAPDHHELIAHGGDFKRYNPNAVHDAATFRGMTTEEIKADSRWAAIHAALPKAWPDMTGYERRTFREHLDAVLPPDPALCARYGLVIAPNPF